MVNDCNDQLKNFGERSQIHRYGNINNMLYSKLDGRIIEKLQFVGV